MENKKLVKILLNDMSELEELIADVKESGKFDLPEMEFLHTRAKGVLQLLRMLNNWEPVPVEKEEVPAKKEIEQELTYETVSAPVEPQPAVGIFEPVIQVPEKEPEPQFAEVSPVELPAENELEVEAPVEEIVTIENELVAPDILPRDVELEDEVVTEANQRLGDSFSKEKSVNDMVSDHNKLEFKLSNRPVSSIQAAIGINDRFQYIRELFDGSGEKFTETVKTLDSMNHISEAVNFLQQNFKWKKNETSLKFVNLVKRRFPNE